MNTSEYVLHVLGRIKMSPSCVDMKWTWEVMDVDNGALLRTTFQRPDTDTGKVERGYGRWWHVPSDVTESGVVKTAFAAMKMILEHELMEAFRYEDRRIFDPHHTMDDLMEACLSRARRCRA